MNKILNLREMPESDPLLKKSDYIVLISILNILIFLFLYVFRHLDDNRLTSWSWVFKPEDVPLFFLILAGALLSAYPLSLFSIRIEKPRLLLFSASFIAAILFFSEPEVIVDASRYFIQAKHLEIYGMGHFVSEWGKSIRAWTDLPLVPAIYGIIFRYFGESRLYVQILNAFLFSFTLLLTYGIGEILWDEETGFTAGMALLGMPYLYTQVPLMLVDIPAMFFLSLSVLTFLRGLERGGAWTVLSSLSLILAFFSKYSIWAMLSVHALIFLLFFFRGDIQRSLILKRGAAVFLIALIFAGVAISVKYDIVSRQLGLLNEYQKPGLKRWTESYLSTFLFQVHPFISVAALFSLYAALKKRDMRFIVISCLPLLLFLLEIKRIRYSIPVFPFLALMSAYGIRRIAPKEIRRYLVFCVALTSFALSAFIYLPFLKNMSEVNLRDAGAFLDSTDAEIAEVITLPSESGVINSAVSVPLLDIHTNKKIIYKYEPPAVPQEMISELPLRFTWEYRNPPFYHNGDEGSARGSMLVVIKSEQGQALPDNILSRTENMRFIKAFDLSTGVFSYNTVVMIYR
ncbi:MAG: glycosyltransferase family 39 protein [Nitrospirae bacterium]|nr:glycosyltransferase family 39 protein [Nitrospirota bacterium]